MSLHAFHHRLVSEVQHAGHDPFFASQPKLSAVQEAQLSTQHSGICSSALTDSGLLCAATDLQAVLIKSVSHDV